MTVVVVGSVNLDTTVDVERLPAEGETLLAGGLRTSLGGKGANQAITAARLGAHTIFVGSVGDDAAGATLRAALDAEGVGTAHLVTRPGIPTGQALITVDRRGANTIVVAAGANAETSVPEEMLAGRRAGAGAVVLTQLEIPLNAVADALRFGRDAGATTMLNPAPAQPLDDGILGLVDILVPNEHEAALLTGIADPAAAAAALPVRNVIVTCGGRGAVMVRDGADPVWFAALPVSAVDTVAAGDAFCGALAAGVAAGLTMEGAIAQGMAAGAHAVTIAGALASLPTAADVERLLSIHHLP